MSALAEQLRDERDGDDAAYGGDERHLGDERWIATVLEAEHGAETCHRHGDDHRVDVVHLLAHSAELEEEVETERYHHQADDGGDVDLWRANDLLDRQLRHRRADDHQGGWHGDVAHHRHRSGDDVGGVDAQRHQEGGEEGGEHRRTNQYLRVELLQTVLALDEHHARRKDEEGVRHIEQGGVEHGMWTEDARNDRVADEAYVGKHQGEANHALVVVVLADKAWHPEAEYQQYDIGEESYAQEGKDERAVGQLIAHH